jgi:hypothetical protein
MPQFDPNDLDRINLVISAACREIGLAIDTCEEGPTCTLLEALGFSPDESTLRLMAAVDVDSVSRRAIDALAELSKDEGCLRKIDGARISRDLLDILLFPSIRARITQRLVEEVSASMWTKEPEADIYALALTTAGAIDAGLIQVDVIDSLEDLQALARRAEHALATAQNQFQPLPFQVPQGWSLLDNGEKVAAALKATQPEDDFNELPWSQADLAAGGMFYMRSPTGELWTVACRSF